MSAFDPGRDRQMPAESDVKRLAALEPTMRPPNLKHEVLAFDIA